MQDGHVPTRVPPRKLLVVLGSSLLAAAVLLVTIVLPAEFGIDPLGAGKAFGLTALAKAAPETQLPQNIAGTAILPVLQSEKQSTRWGESAVVKGAFIAQPQRFNIDSREITLAPGEGMEIKYHLQKGAGLVYSWTASGAVLFDFHAEPDVKPDAADSEYFESYETQDADGKGQAHGTLIAPSTGIHGWYWENPSAETVDIKLVSSGFFDWIFHSRDEHKDRFKPTDPYSLASHPALPDEPL